MHLFLFLGCCTVLLSFIDQTDAAQANSIVGYRAPCSTYNRIVSATPAVFCSYCKLYGTTTVVGAIRCTSKNNVCYSDFEGTPEQFAVGETQIPTLTNIGTSGVVIPCGTPANTLLTGPQILASSLGADTPVYSFTLVNSSVARLLDTATFPSPIYYDTVAGRLGVNDKDPGVDVTYTYALTLIDRNTGAVSAPVYLTVKLLTCRLNVACTPTKITVCSSINVFANQPYTGFSCKVTNENFPYTQDQLSWDFRAGDTKSGCGTRVPLAITSSDGDTGINNNLLASLGGGLYGVGCKDPTAGVITQTESITVDVANPAIPYQQGTTQITVSTDPSTTCTSLAAVAS